MRVTNRNQDCIEFPLRTILDANGPAIVSFLRVQGLD